MRYDHATHDNLEIGQFRDCKWLLQRLSVACIVVSAGLADQTAYAGEGIILTLPLQSVRAQQVPSKETDGSTDVVSTSFFSGWTKQVERARASQPSWSSPLVTTTGLLENRLRFDFEALHAANGTETTALDGGKGLDLIVSESNEIQLGAAPYDIRTSRSGGGALSGFADWSFLRVERRLASSPEAGGAYVVTAWLSVQAPTGITSLTSDAWTFSPTVAFGLGELRYPRGSRGRAPNLARRGPRPSNPDKYRLPVPRVGCVLARGRGELDVLRGWSARGIEPSLSNPRARTRPFLARRKSAVHVRRWLSRRHSAELPRKAVNSSV